MNRFSIFILSLITLVVHSLFIYDCNYYKLSYDKVKGGTLSNINKRLYNHLAAHHDYSVLYRMCLLAFYLDDVYHVPVELSINHLVTVYSDYDEKAIISKPSTYKFIIFQVYDDVSKYTTAHKVINERLGNTNGRDLAIAMLVTKINADYFRILESRSYYEKVFQEKIPHKNFLVNTSHIHNPTNLWSGDTNITVCLLIFPGIILIVVIALCLFLNTKDESYLLYLKRKRSKDSVTSCS